MTDWDRHELYETCVQSVDHLAPLLRAIHGARPRVLGEDFSGTAALSHAWVGSDPEARAIGVDLDDEALRKHPAHERVDARLADVRDVSDPCDVLFVGNFSIGYLHTRGELVEYLRHAHSRLNPGGVFVCDTYGGETAWTIGDVHRPHSLGGGWVCRYTWEQSEADPLTGMVVNRIHFRIERAGVIEQEILDAFVYRWRLWSVPELRDAMGEAGFETTQVYAKLAEAVDDEGNAYTKPVTDPEELDGSFIVLVAARAGSG